MPRTVNEGFVDFLPRLTPSGPESEAANNHRASIEACLKVNFGLRRFFRVGSFGNGTSVSGHSDVDYFASIPGEKLQKNSSNTLRDVREVLGKRFPTSNVHVDCPAVVVPFGTSARETTEVVPADFVKKLSGGYSLYEIADCSGGWMQSSPEAHNAYVREVDQKLGGKLKPLIRFVKAWKYFRNVPISSFYLELRVTKYAADESSIVYSIDMRNFLVQLDNAGLPALRDPLGISGLIAPCSTDAKLVDAKSKLSTAATRAKKAREAEENDHIKEAFEWWGLLYDGRFPSYYK